MTLKVLSVHTSNKCSAGCPFCYLDKSDIENEKPHEWWVQFFHQVEKVEQIALAWNEQPVNDICTYIGIAKQKGIIVNITCNPKNIDELNISQLKKAGVTMISISVDRYKVKNIWDTENPLKIIKSAGLFAGINLLLDPEILLNLEKIIPFFYEMEADMVYALHPKPDTLAISNEKLKSQLLLSSFLFGQKFAVDEASKLKLGKSRSCNRGRDLLSINAKGEVCLCSFDKGMEEFTGKLTPINIETEACPFL
jgi:MoaA/NifB/PqqE/SkfB family radical SAM enzyme